MTHSRFRFALACSTLVLAGAGTAQAQVRVPYPDVIAGDIPDTCHFNAQAVDGKHAYAIGTTGCNIGGVAMQWHLPNGEHPVIASGMFRLLNGRFEQVGQAWPKHAFGSDNGTLCGTCPVPGNGTALMPGCSDWYDCNTNAAQGLLGPKRQVNAATGALVYPFSDGQGSGVLYKRLQVHEVDLANPGALYFVEAQYIQYEDAAAGRGSNNASYRRITVNPSTFNLTLVDTTQRTKPAIQAWADHGLGTSTPDPGVMLTNVDIPGDGRFIVGSKVTNLGGGMWHYEYAIQNLNSDRSAGMFLVPVPDSAVVTNVAFHGVEYHSGEVFDNTPWGSTVSGDGVRWSSPQTFDQNPDSNALRWGTLYNYRFDANVAPLQQPGPVTLGLFLPGTPSTVTAAALVPSENPGCPCDWNLSGTVNSQDYFDFLSDFFNGNADYNNSGDTNSQDFFDFLACFFVPCS